MDTILVEETPHVPRLLSLSHAENIIVDYFKTLIEERKNVNANFDKNDQPSNDDGHENCHDIDEDDIDNDDDMGHVDDDNHFEMENVNNPVDYSDKELVYYPSLIHPRRTLTPNKCPVRNVSPI